MNRRIKFIVLILLLPCWCIGQEVIHIDHFPPNGLLLKKGWLYKPGDDPNNASPDFDDSHWKSINPAQDIKTELTELVPGQIGWFRLHFSTGEKVSDNLGMILQLSGASEFYLDGKMIQRLGTISQSADVQMPL